MPTLTDTAVYDALRLVQEPELGGDLMSRNMVKGLAIDGSHVALTIELTTPACVVIGWVALAAPRRPRLAQLCFLVVGAFLIVNKVWSPQYSLWLVPLVVLAIPRWKPVLAWMSVEVLLWVPRMAYYLGPDHKGLPIEPFLGAVLIRDLAVIMLMALILRDVFHPTHDPIRITGDDDPHGGVLDNAPDHPRLLPRIQRAERGSRPSNNPAQPAECA
ncbi:MAG: iron-sulfur cluster assembly protein [Pseudonocardiaceae bacterium]